MSLLAQTATEVYDQAFRAGLRPDPLLTISEWADRYRRLSGKASAEPGPWRTARTPYLREIMDCLSPSSHIERVVFMKGSQIGGTECGNNWIGYVIHKAPGPMLVVQPTVDLAKRNSRQRIDPLIEESKVLRQLVKSPRSRDSGNTVMSKQFPGGVLVATGANSAVGLRSMAVRYLFLDEVDAYPGDVDGEGDPVNLAYVRTRTYSRRKIFLCSTPLITGRSRIEAAYLESDQRRYWVPCPHCGEFQVLKFERLRWPKGEPQNVSYSCVGCQQPIFNHHKNWMLEHGEWKPEAEGDGRTRGYHLSSLYSPVGWYGWNRVADDWEKAQQNNERLQSFVNTVLGESWTERGEAPDHEKLMSRREDSYLLGQVPPGVLFLTTGVDVQATWLEGYVYGWGRGKQRWVIDHFRIDKNPYDPTAWDDLTEQLNRTYGHPSGVDLSIVRMAVDSGHATQQVYSWAKQQGSGRVMAVDGRATGAAVVGIPTQVDINLGGKKIRHGAKLWPVNVSMAKSELYGLLGKDRPADGEPYPPGWIHFPADLDQEFFLQLTAEHLTAHVVKGYRKYEWIKTRERNEALDCANYARAAAGVVGLDRRGSDDQWWREMEARCQVASPPKPVAIAPAVPPAPDRPQQVSPPPRRESWFGQRGRREGWFSR